VGRKRSRAGQYLYVCAACLITIVLAACAPLKTMADRQESRDHLLRAHDLVDVGDYDGAVRENQMVLSLSPDESPGDEALFSLGLIYAHYGNPKKDFKRSLGFFSRVVKEFPGSPLADEAKIWIGVLGSIEKAKQVDIQIEEKKKELTK
jgi:outer membrane protein assembly factor BamD (BamD/ComL family)